MAVLSKPFLSTRRYQAKYPMVHYRYLISMILFLCLMSLLTLGQTGVVATRGYAVAELEAKRTMLLREQGQLKVRDAIARSMDNIQKRAEKIGLRLVTSNQMRYLPIDGEWQVTQDKQFVRRRQVTVSPSKVPHYSSIQGR